MTCMLGSRDIVAGTDYDIMTPWIPRLLRSHRGRQVGDVISYTAPNGAMSVTVKGHKPLA